MLCLILFSTDVTYGVGCNTTNGIEMEWNCKEMDPIKYVRQDFSHGKNINYFLYSIIYSFLHSG